jgi:hypothetical protein
MNQSAATAAEVEDDDHEAFEARVMQLYDQYDNWTGEVEEGEAPVTTQEDGSPIIGAGLALSTFVMFTVRLATDLGVSNEEFDEILGEIREAIAEEGDGDEDEDGDDDEPSQ